MLRTLQQAMPFSSSHPNLFSSTRLLGFIDLHSTHPLSPTAAFLLLSSLSILHPGRNNPRHHCMVGATQLEISLAGKDLWVLVDSKLNMNQQWALHTKRANSMLGCIRQSTASRSGEVLSTSEATAGVLCPVLGSSAHNRDMDILERVQLRATKMIKGLEHPSMRKG